jgi:hypothetical protein
MLRLRTRVLYMSPISHRLSLSSPLTQRTLTTIRSLIPPLPAGTFARDQTPAAAVLIPLCNVRNRPCLLFEVRGNTRVHAGEVWYVTHTTVKRFQSLDYV